MSHASMLLIQGVVDGSVGRSLSGLFAFRAFEYGAAFIRIHGGCG